jgi:hypothetical protein
MSGIMGVTRVGDPQFLESTLDRFRADPRRTWRSLLLSSIAGAIMMATISFAIAIYHWARSGNQRSLRDMGPVVAMGVVGVFLGALYELTPRSVTVQDQHLLVSRGRTRSFSPYARIRLAPATNHPYVVRVSCESELDVLWLRTDDVALFHMKIAEASALARGGSAG